MGAPEVHRSGHTPVDPDHAAEVADQGPPTSSGSGPGPVPPDNRPGHRPAEEQDKPRRRPPRPRRSRARAAETGAAATGTASADAAVTEDDARDAAAEPGVTVTTFPFAFDDAVGAAARVFGVSPATAAVRVDGEHLTVTFGRWTLRTALGNVAATTRSGPYDWWKVAGPPRLSLADRGITFATSARAGLCISFYEPVPAAMPTSLLRHPAATVTVTDPDGLAEALAAATERIRSA